MGLNKREIAVIVDANRSNYSIQIKATEGGEWQASIKIFQPEKHYDVFTFRGEVKTWHNLASAITFFQEMCEDCEDVQIDTGKWKFSRII